MTHSGFTTTPPTTSTTDRPFLHPLPYRETPAMSISAQLVETIADATGLARSTVRSTFAEISHVLGDRLGVMQQRIGGIMANAGGGSGAGIDDALAYTDSALTPADKSKVFGALGLGFIGGLLLASAAGSIAVLLVGLLCLAMAGMLLLSYAKSLIARLSEALDGF
jgi:hypothetical protein